MSRDAERKATQAAAEPEANQSNLIWGAEAIGREVNRSAEQVRRLHALGFFQGAVWKAGHRTYVGNLQRLRALHNS
jgi:hypothetical protein